MWAQWWVTFLPVTAGAFLSTPSSRDPGFRSYLPWVPRHHHHRDERSVTLLQSTPGSSSSSFSGRNSNLASSSQSSFLASSNSPSPPSSEEEDLVQQEWARVAAHVQRLQKTPPPPDPARLEPPPDPLGAERQRLVREYLLQSAQALKTLCRQRHLATTGRKPDLALRLAEVDLQAAYGYSTKKEVDELPAALLATSLVHADPSATSSTPDAASSMYFAGLRLSPAATQALRRAGYHQPSPIQAAALPALMRGESAILHAATGSGKTLAYLLPLTESLWQTQKPSARSTAQESPRFGVIVTPTRELAAQVAGIAAVLAPPGTVRLVAQPMNVLASSNKERGEAEQGGRPVDVQEPRLFVGSAKALMHSLYGDGAMPAPPTSKPEAMFFLRNLQWLVLDEVDRLLQVRSSSSSKREKPSAHVHEKPAAVVCAAAVRLTVGQVQVLAASATVGRPLKRELARVMGLTPQECPRVIRAGDDVDPSTDDSPPSSSNPKTSSAPHFGRAVTIPDTVQHYVVAAEGGSDGQLLTTAYQVLQPLAAAAPRRILMVLTRGFGIHTQNVIGALRHFQCRPEPQSLLDALQADGTDRMIEQHRRVSGASGIGESAGPEKITGEPAGYLLVTGEDTVRGLHLDALDVVLVLGRPLGPDEYTHIAGRTGRAGRPGQVINILSRDQVASLTAWENILEIKFHPLALADVASL